jgi:hypothetical protein
MLMHYGPIIPNAEFEHALIPLRCILVFYDKIIMFQFLIFDVLMSPTRPCSPICVILNLLPSFLLLPYRPRLVSCTVRLRLSSWLYLHRGPSLHRLPLAAFTRPRHLFLLDLIQRPLLPLQVTL